MRGIETIARNANKQAEILEHLLDVSRMAAGKVELTRCGVDVHAAVVAAVETVAAAAASKGVTVDNAVSDSSLRVWGDAHRVQQVLTNLLSNAVKFNRDGGRVDVRAAREGASVVFRISDTGKGIPAEMLSRVFGTFWQADSSIRRAHGGLGLGLSIVHHLVDLHGGQVRVESLGENRRNSSIVSLPVPADDDPAVRSSLSEEPSWSVVAEASHDEWDDAPDERRERESTRPLEGTRVLVVDHNALATDFLCDALRASRRRGACRRRCSPSAGRVAHVRPDVILCDVAMPEFDGYALLRRIRGSEKARHVSAIALTAPSNELDAGELLASGFDAHLVKPESAAGLADLVSAVTSLRASDEQRL